jgi:hypothetical protein
MLSLGPVNINRYKIYRESEERKLMRFLLLRQPLHFDPHWSEWPNIKGQSPETSPAASSLPFFYIRRPFESFIFFSIPSTAGKIE